MQAELAEGARVLTSLVSLAPVQTMRSVSADTLPLPASSSRSMRTERYAAALLVSLDAKLPSMNCSLLRAKTHQYGFHFFFSNRIGLITWRQPSTFIS